MNSLKNEIIKKLSEIKYPGFNRDIISFGILKDIILDNNTVRDVHIEDGAIKYVDPKQAEIERIKNIPETLEGN